MEDKQKNKHVNEIHGRIKGGTECLNLRNRSLIPLGWHVLKDFLDVKWALQDEKENQIFQIRMSLSKDGKESKSRMHGKISK